MSDDRGGFRVSAIQVAAGAAAAATAAFAASALGVAGTIVGAALVSATITVLAAVYDHSLRRARTRIREIRVVQQAKDYEQTQVMQPVTSDTASQTGADGETGPAASPEDDATTTAVLPALRLEGDDGYHWRRIAVVSLLLFGLAMAAITAFELITGKPVSALFGGDDSAQTTIGSVIDRPHRGASPSGSTSPTPTPSATATVTETATTTPPATTSAPPATTTSAPPTTTSPATSTTPPTTAASSSSAGG